jgi:hypothetical protein
VLRFGYVDEYVQGLWVAFKVFGAERPAPVAVKRIDYGSLDATQRLAFCRALPFFSNELILMLHSTSVAFPATVPDLLKIAQDVNSATYASFTAFGIAGTLYTASASFVIYYESWGDRGSSISPITARGRMSINEIHPEDGQGLLCELNATTEEMMSIGLNQVGKAGWHEAHRRQQAAFACCLRYLRREPEMILKTSGSAAA